jgi:hypothetical protein
MDSQKSLLKGDELTTVLGGNTTITIFPFPARVLTTVATINIF